MQPSRTSDGEPAVARRRWLIVMVVGLLMLAVYAVALTLLTHKLQTDIQKSIRPLPVAREDHHIGE